jgi:hypothetical protein
MVIKVLDERRSAAIACGQTKTFGGLDGPLPSEPEPPQLCEGS